MGRIAEIGPKASFVSGLRIIGESIRREELDHSLDLSPSRWSSADSPGGEVRLQLYGLKTSVWSWKSSTSKWEPPEVHIANVLVQLEGHEVFLKSLTEQCKVQITLGTFFHTDQYSFTLPHNLLEKLASLSIDVWLDYYLNRDNAE